MLSKLRAQLRALLLKSKVEHDLDEELRHHLEQQTAQNIRLGMDPEEAQYAARKAFGGVEQAKERSRDTWGVRWLEEFWQDLRYGVRMLLKNPGFTLFAVITLALGIGANTAIFSALMTVLVRPLPVKEPDRLVYLWNQNQAFGVYKGYFRDEEVLDFRKRAASCTQIAAWALIYAHVKGAKPARVEGMMVEPHFFQTLGVQPLLGRAFVEDEDDDVAIISYGLWQRQFGGDPNLIGREINLGYMGEDPQILLGVMPPEFDFPLRTEVWFPYKLESGSFGNHYHRAIARLKRGVTPQQAQAELNAIARASTEPSPNKNAEWEVSVVPFREYLFGSTQVAFPLLLGAVGCVLLIACTNIANFQLSRAARRQKEIAVRLALGAGRLRIVRQLLTESILLALAGGAMGLLTAMWIIDLLRTMGPDSIPRLRDVPINTQMLWVSVALSILTGILFGLAPAWQSSNPDLHHALKDGALPVTASSRGRRFRQVLVVSQVALSLSLLIGAGLLIQSFRRVKQIDIGFDAEHILTAGVSLSLSDYPAYSPRMTAYFQQALARISGLPGVASVGAISQLPLGGRGVSMKFEIQGQSRRAVRTDLHAEMRVITPSYFDAMQIPLLSGRLLSERDTSSSPGGIVINESFARNFFPGRNPIGERLKLKLMDNFFAIVGIVGDVRHRGREADALPEMYVSYLQKTVFPVMVFVVRTTADPASFAAGVRRELQAIDPRQPVYNVQPMERLASASIGERRFNMFLLATFAGLAALLAACGIYGVISHSVAERSRDLGIRLALGAQSGDVLKLVIGHGLALTSAGITIGLITSLVLTRLMKTLLFGVGATDPIVFTGTALLVTFIGLSACWIPARRATKVDPMIALRCE